MNVYKVYHEENSNLEQAHVINASSVNEAAQKWGETVFSDNGYYGVPSGANVVVVVDQQGNQYRREVYETVVVKVN